MDMEESLKKTIATYNMVLESYISDTQNKQPVLEFTLFCSHLLPGGTVLDVGCAWGRDSKELAAQGFQVKGVDLSENFLAYARTYTQDYTSRCEFLVADVRQLPFTNAFFDGIWCCACLLHLERDQIPAALRELKRAVKTEGICAILVKKGQGDTLQPYHSADTCPLRYFTYFQEGELCNLCTAAGFTIIETNTSNERDTQGSQGRDQEWIFVLLRKEDAPGT